MIVKCCFEMEDEASIAIIKNLLNSNFVTIELSDNIAVVIILEYQNFDLCNYFQ